MKDAISLEYIGERHTSDPKQADGRLSLAGREIPFKVGNTKDFPVSVPLPVAVELVKREDGKQWKCATAEGKKAVEAAIAAEKKAAEALTPAPAPVSGE